MGLNSLEVRGREGREGIGDQLREGERGEQRGGEGIGDKPREGGTERGEEGEKMET